MVSEKNEVVLTHAVGWSRTPIAITGKLDGNRSQPDECAHVIKMMGREIFGFSPEELKKISVSGYFGGELKISFDSMSKENAWLMRNLLMDHSHGRVIADHNNGLNAKAIKYHTITPSKSLVMTLTAIADKYNLTDKVEECVKEVQETQEKERAAEALQLSSPKAKPVPRGHLEMPTFTEASTPESTEYFEKAAASLRVIAEHCGFSEEELKAVFIVLDGNDVHVRLSDNGDPAAAHRLTETLVRYSGGQATATGHVSHFMFGQADDVNANAKDLATTLNLAIASFGLENQADAAFNKLNDVANAR